MDKSNNDNELDNEEILQLGDTIFITGGTLAGTRGKIYYISDELIRIMPFGVSNRLIDIPIIDGAFDSELEIGDDDLKYEKGTAHSFVALQDLHVGQMIEAFKDGKLVNKYALKEVNEKEDSIVLVDENEEQFNVSFDFTGIPLDLPFDVLRGREVPQVVKEEEIPEEIDELEEEEAPDTIDFFEEEVVVEAQGIQEIPSAKRNYPDSVQRSDMIQEFIKQLPTKSQKNENKLRAIRRLVELCLLMRNEIVKYSLDGLPVGVKQTTFETILELAQSDDVSFSIPVADVKRVFYFDHFYEGELRPRRMLPDPVYESENCEIRYTIDEINKEIDLLKQLAGNQVVDSINQLPNYYLNFNKLFKNNYISWLNKDKLSNTSFKKDKDFFRSPIPDMETPSVEGLPVILQNLVNSDFLSSVYFSKLRGLKERVGRLKVKEPKQILESAEEATIQSYLIFPKSTEREFGSIRSGKLAYDIARSMAVINTVEDILKNGIQDVPTTGSILALGATGNTLGNISIDDWLRNIPLILYGLGDALIELSSYGFNQKEFSHEQQVALIEKIEESIAHVKNHIKYIREKENVEQQVIVKKNLIVDERLDALLKNMTGEAILLKLINQLQRRTPNYKESDVAIFAYLFSKAQDVLLSKLGNSNLLAYYRTRFVNQEYIERLQEGYLLKVKSEEAVYVPFENKCIHVKSLNIIRKVKDDSNRMKLLSKFLTKFQSYKRDNWIYCVECDKHLLCNHEFILLQEYLHPREKDTLHKELLLTFSGGVFQGKYICKNCGQPISSLEFDTSLEYDDDGRPMMGRSVLVDQEQIEEDNINSALGAPTDSVEPIKFDTEAKTLYYQTAKDIFDLIGVYPDAKSYTDLVEGVNNEMGNQPERETYIKKNKGNKSAMPYDNYISLVLVGIVASYCMVEIQTHIPNYTPRVTVQGCIPDFRGYPIGNESDRRMIEYMSCILSNINSKNPPWSATGILDQKDLKKRKKTYENVIEKVLKSVVIKSDVMNMIIKKKTYNAEQYGKFHGDSMLEEVTLHGFRPLQLHNEDEVIVTKAANTIEKIRGILLESNKLAKESMKSEIIPFSERTCCMNSIQQPLSFWKSKEIQTIAPKSALQGPINSHSMFQFVLRKEGRIEKEITKDDYNAIFMKVCYKGENIGRSHEFGYDNICYMCGLDKSSLINYDNKEIISEKTANERLIEYNGVIDSLLKTQGVEVTKESFEKLLNTVNLVNSVIPKPVERIKINTPSKEIYNQLFGLTPEPFDGWRELINKLFEQLLRDNSSATVESYGEVSNKYIIYMNELQKMIGDKMKNILETILNQPVRQLVESVRSGILVNLQRAVRGLNMLETKFERTKEYGLEGNIVEDINRFLNLHTQYITIMNQKIKGFAKSKILYGIDKLSNVLNVFQTQIRGPLLPKGNIGVPYLLKTAVVGILYELINPNIGFPDTYAVEEATKDTGSLPREILIELLTRYNSERFELTEDEMRIAIAKRNEQEKVLFINKLDRMTPEEKRQEQLNKRLGLGDWARGGSKGIYAFDPEQYDFERDQRAQMGLFDASDVAVQQQMNAEMAMDSGYDNEQINADDY